jgi:hypothetical protein
MIAYASTLLTPCSSKSRALAAAGHSLVLSQGYLKKIKKGAKKVNFSQGCFTMAQGGGLKARLYHNPFSSPLGS